MTDMFSREERSLIMSKIRSSGNVATELRFLNILRKAKISGWRRGVNLPGRPDFVFTRAKLAIFIDGDFWHGNPRRFRIPKSNVDYWHNKITKNRARDRQINKILRRRGWIVRRFWQSSLGREKTVVLRLRRALDISE